MNKRLFFGFKALSPLLHSFPEGRTLDPASRHLTLAFLGNVDSEPLETNLESHPPFPFQVGLTGFASHLLFLPPKSPRVVAWHIECYQQAKLLHFHEQLRFWINQQGYSLENRPLLPHVTIARKPFNKAEWKRAFSKIPLYFDTFTLYESKPELRYVPVYEKKLLLPFEEIEHTADRAFLIRGEEPKVLFYNALTALSCSHPELLDVELPSRPCDDLKEIIQQLNTLISHADENVGVDLKAVSYHSSLREKTGYFEWEMIVDV